MYVCMYEPFTLSRVELVCVQGFFFLFHVMFEPFTPSCVKLVCLTGGVCRAKPGGVICRTKPGEKFAGQNSRGRLPGETR